MKVELEDLWRYSPGITLGVEGTRYMNLGNTEWGHEVYDYATGLVEVVDEDAEVQVLDLGVDVNKLLAVEVSRTLGLVYDGWKLGGGRYLDLDPVLEKLRGLAAVKKVLG